MADGRPRYQNDYTYADNYYSHRINHGYYSPPEGNNYEYADEPEPPAGNNIPMNTYNNDERPPEPPPYDPLNHSYLNQAPEPPQDQQADHPPAGRSKSKSKRCLCYTVIVVVVLLLCGTAVGVTYIVLTSSSNPSGVSQPPVPITSCPEPIRTDAPAKSNSTNVFWKEPVATIPGNISSVEKTHGPGDLFYIGSTYVTYTFTDKTGNKGLCSFDITVVDTTPPDIVNCPVDREYFITNNNDEQITWAEPTASDNSGGMIQVTQSHSQGFLFPAGDTTVLYQFTDTSGNQASCVFTITVTGIRPPVVSNCPQDIARTVTPGGTSSVPVWWTEPSAVNPSGGTLDFVRSHQPGDSFSTGQTTVTYTFTGDRGLQSICEFTIDVVVTDGTPPEISHCPSDIAQNAPADGNSVVVWWNEPRAYSPGGATVTLQEPLHNPGDIYEIGTTDVNYVFLDNIGLRSTCSFRITVVDITPPSVQSCPLDIRSNGLSNTVGDGVQITWTEPTATDNSGQPISVDQSHSPGSIFTHGVTEVTYVFRDHAGLEAMCAFYVTVPDTGPPTVHQCPEDMTFQYDSSSIYSINNAVYWSRPYATDSSGNVTLVRATHQSGSYFTSGDSMVEYVFSDSDGNIAKCSFTVTGVSKSGSIATTASTISGSTVSVIIILIILCYLYAKCNE